jgi:rhodanese-related sulfurtransferase
MKKLFLILLVFPAVVSAQEASALTEKVKSILGFTAPTIYVEELKKMDNVVLLDARARKEFDVSHLRGAVHVGEKRVDLNLLGNVNEEDTIIVYCTVGYRSEKIAEKLIDAGYKNTYNLFGGIFAWKNDDQEVVDNSGRATEKVHCYDKSWSLLLLNGEKVY